VGDGESLATSDAAVARIAAEEGIDVLPLPSAVARVPRL
jgi:hypothetical protein